MANIVMLIGRVATDLELRHTQSGQTNTSFTLAVDRGLSKDKKQEQEAKGYPTADFIRIVAWGKTAELAQRFLGKGLRVGVQGRIQTGSYINQQGQTVYTTDVVAERLEFIDFKEQGQGQSQSQNNPDDDFIPFDETGGYVPF